MSTTQDNSLMGRMLIGGRLVEGNDGWLESINPATEGCAGRVPGEVNATSTMPSMPPRPHNPPGRRYPWRNDPAICGNWPTP